MCPKLGHVSEVGTCVRSWDMCPKLGHVSEVGTCVRSWDMCPKLGHVSEVETCVRSWGMFPKLAHVSEVWAYCPNPFMMQVREGDRDQRNDRGHEALQAQRRRERNDLLFIIS